MMGYDDSSIALIAKESVSLRLYKQFLRTLLSNISLSKRSCINVKGCLKRIDYVGT